MSDRSAADEARSSINWLRRVTAEREKERDRCFELVYSALLSAEGEEAVEALKALAYSIADPK